MKGWLVSVAVLFVLAEVCLWLKDFILPLPIYLLGGAFLAIASNYEKGMDALFRQESSQSVDTVSQTATLVEKVNFLESQSTSLSFVAKNQQQSSAMAISPKARHCAVQQHPLCGIAEPADTAKQEKP